MHRQANDESSDDERELQCSEFQLTWSLIKCSTKCFLQNIRDLKWESMTLAPTQVLDFGAHKGKTFAKVQARHPSYWQATACSYSQSLCHQCHAGHENNCRVSQDVREVNDFKELRSLIYIERKKGVRAIEFSKIQENRIEEIQFAN